MDSLLLLVDAPALAVQLVIEGLLVGAIFALTAYGMALVWGVMNIINIVQGEWVMLGSRPPSPATTSAPRIPAWAAASWPAA